METGIKLASGDLSDWDALGVSGDPVYRAAQQIVNLIKSNLGAEFAHVFAVPVRDDQRLTIDWYSSVTGSVKTWSQLSDSERTNLKQILDQRLNEVASYAQKLGMQKAESARTYSALLNAAQQYPNSDCIYSVNDSPVLVFWGFGMRANDAKRMNAMGAVVMPSAVSAPSPSTNLAQESSAFPPHISANLQNKTEDRPFWQRYGWWMLLGLILLIGLLSLIRGCSTDFPLLGRTAGVPNAGSNAGPALPDTVSGAGPGAGSVYQGSNNPVDSGTSVAGPSGDLPLPITPEALKQNDLTVFYGRWSLSSSNVVNSRTGKPIQVEFGFNQNGDGLAKVIEQNGNVCSGQARARIEPPDQFSVESDTMPCANDGSKYQPLRANCTINKNQQANCVMNGASGPFPVEFSRIR